MDEPNYIKKINALIASGVFTGSVYDLVIAHDDTCPVLTGAEGVCDCDPDISNGLTGEWLTARPAGTKEDAR